MSEFKITRLSLDEQRTLNMLADSVKHRVPVFNGGDNGREAPLHTRRQFLKTSSGVVAVTFMPRERPSVESMEMARTVSSPMCFWVSRIKSPPSRSMVRASKILGRATPCGKLTSTTGPMTWAMVPC